MIERKHLVGTWLLAKHGRYDREGGYHATGTGTSGQLMYAPDGSMGVLITIKPEPEQLKDIIAYSGTFTIEGDKIFHHITVSPNAKRLKTTETRLANLRGNELVLTTDPNNEGHYEIIWHRKSAEHIPT
jgi:hypothetical protein